MADYRQKKPVLMRYLSGVEEYLNKKITCYREPIFYIAQYLENQPIFCHEDYQRFEDAMTIFGYDIYELRDCRAAGMTGLDIAREIVARST